MDIALQSRKSSNESFEISKGKQATSVRYSTQPITYTAFFFFKAMSLITHTQKEICKIVVQYGVFIKLTNFNMFLRPYAMSKIYQNVFILGPLFSASSLGAISNFPSCSAQKRELTVFSCCKINGRKQRGRERKVSHLHHRCILPVCMTLIATRVQNVPPGQKRTRNTCPSTASQCETFGRKQSLMINQLGSVSMWISRAPSVCTFPIPSSQ